MERHAEARRRATGGPGLAAENVSTDCRMPARRCAPRGTRTLLGRPRAAQQPQAGHGPGRETAPGPRRPIPATRAAAALSTSSTTTPTRHHRERRGRVHQVVGGERRRRRRPWRDGAATRNALVGLARGQAERRHAADGVAGEKGGQRRPERQPGLGPHAQPPRLRAQREADAASARMATGPSRRGGYRQRWERGRRCGPRRQRAAKPPSAATPVRRYCRRRVLIEEFRPHGVRASLARARRKP